MSAENKNTNIIKKIVLSVFVTIFYVILFIEEMITTFLKERFKTFFELFTKVIDLLVDKVNGILLAVIVGGLEMSKLVLKFGLIHKVESFHLGWILTTISIIILWILALILGAVSIMIIVRGREKMRQYLLVRMIWDLVAWVFSPVFWLKDLIKNSEILKSVKKKISELKKKLQEMQERAKEQNKSLFSEAWTEAREMIRKRKLNK